MKIWVPMATSLLTISLAILLPGHAQASDLVSCLNIGNIDVNGTNTIQFGQPYDVQIDNNCGRDISGFSSILRISGPINRTFQDAYFDVKYGPVHNYAEFKIGVLPIGRYTASLQVNIQEDNSSVTFPVEGFNFLINQRISHPQVKRTIVCVRGNSIKREFGLSRKCPAGYKLKK
jgi:hypothetical protein